jgi:hypothetical protein
MLEKCTYVSSTCDSSSSPSGNALNISSDGPPKSDDSAARRRLAFASLARSTSNESVRSKLRRSSLTTYWMVWEGGYEDLSITLVIFSFFLKGGGRREGDIFV